MTHPYLDTDRPIAFAHRGGDVDGLENSMPAFADAVELGYGYVETDVRATRDGVLVLFHDRTLDRVTDGAGIVAEMAWEDLRGARIRGTEPIPRLEELLEAWPQLRINLDVKSDEAVRPLVPLLRREDVVQRVCVGSFSDARLRVLRSAVGRSLCSSAGPAEITRLRIGAPARRPRRGAPGPSCVQVPIRRGPIRVVDDPMLDRCHRRGLPLHVWTINQRAAMERLLDLGVDGIMTDATRVLRDVLTERGQWG